MSLHKLMSEVSMLCMMNVLLTGDKNSECYSQCVLNLLHDSIIHCNSCQTNNDCRHFRYYRHQSPMKFILKFRNTKARKAVFKRFINVFIFYEYHAGDVTILYILNCEPTERCFYYLWKVMEIFKKITLLQGH